MLDAILITVGIVVAACSVSYKLLLLMYRPTPEGRTQTPTIADAVDSRRSCTPHHAPPRPRWGDAGAASAAQNSNHAPRDSNPQPAN